VLFSFFFSCFFFVFPEFRFDVSNDALLQDEPLLFRVCDSDALSIDESIGVVYIDLNPLLTQTAANENLGEYDVAELHLPSRNRNSHKNDHSNVGMLDGWFPLYDTLGGVRGELELSVKLNFIGDVNPFRDSSAGVQLFPFSTLDPASGLSVVHIFGFVEELVVADDPEFNDSNNSTSNTGNNNNNNSNTLPGSSSLRKSRISHETRQTLLYLLDAAVRRKMCKTVLDKGGNAVLGYHQNFDVEGDSGIVARTYGTCVRLERRPTHSQLQQQHQHQLLQQQHQLKRRLSKGPRPGGRSVQIIQTDSDREDEDDDVNAPHPRSTYGPTKLHALPEPHSDEHEVQLLTLKDFDPKVRVRIGGLVTARSVKYLGNLASKLSDQEQRDSWWKELRDEIRSHAKILCCTHVVGYLEASTIHEDVAVLSITGTACTVRGLPDIHNLHHSRIMWGNDYHAHAHSANDNGTSSSPKKNSMISNSNTRSQERRSRRSRRNLQYNQTASVASSQTDADVDNITNNDTMMMMDTSGGGSIGGHMAAAEEGYHHGKGGGRRTTKRSSHSHHFPKDGRSGNRIIRARDAKPCSYCHVPYHHRLAPFTNMKLVPCMLCGKKWVPEVVLATCEPPSRLPIRGPGVFLQARVCRSRPLEKNSESDALAVSEALPFLEYELARQLMLK
jgi:hypothetical protein